MKKMLDVIEKLGGRYEGGFARDHIYFEGPDHEKRAKEAFRLCRQFDYNVYNLRHMPETSYFEHR